MQFNAAHGASAVKAEILAEVEASGIPEVSVMFRAVRSDMELSYRPEAVYHAASTMKVPVMVAAYALASSGLLKLDQPIPIYNRFKSIADASIYSVDPEEDSETELYGQLGAKLPVRDLVDRMITHSSNLATNILVDRITPEFIQELMDGLGCWDFRVLRGVEDGPAYRAGLNNQVTARAYGELLLRLATGTAVSPEADREMVAVMKRQTHRAGLPSGAPGGFTVASKPGWTSKVVHDGGIFYRGDEAQFVLCVLTAGATSETEARGLMGRLAALACSGYYKENLCG